MRWRRLGTLALVLVTLQAVAPSSAVALEPTGATVVRIRIFDNVFRNGTVTIDRGTVVRWRNSGDNIHTTTSNAGIWDSGNLQPGELFGRRFGRLGTFRYHCEIHSTMRGTITVA